MNTAKRIALVPAYQPEALMLPLIRELKSAKFDIVVVDDGSGREYRNLFVRAEAYATVLAHSENRGKGAALKTGLAYLLENYEEGYTVVTVDADGQHTVQDALKVIQEAEAHPDTLVLGSRALKKKVPLRSRIGNGITRMIFRLTTGCRVRDTQTGLRAFSSALIPRLLENKGERYEYEMNMLLDFTKEKRPIREVMIETIYRDNNSGSHFNAWKDSFRIYKEILKFAAASLTSFALDYMLYVLFSAATKGFGAASLAISNIAARMISGSVNFAINKHLVFEDKEAGAAAALKYALLAIMILLGNTMVLKGLVDVLGMDRYVAKVVTEVVFFLGSWLAQKMVIFRKKEVSI